MKAGLSMKQTSIKTDAPQCRTLFKKGHEPDNVSQKSVFLIYKGHVIYLFVLAPFFLDTITFIVHQPSKARFVIHSSNTEWQWQYFT